MKTTIASILVRNAIEYFQQAQLAKTEMRPDDEMRFSISAHLMIALTIEGIGNEVGEVVFEAWVWNRLEKYDTPLKWHFISSFGGRKPFDPGAEPLQTVQRLTFIRNRLAHPKIENFGDEIIVRSENGNIHRNVGLDHLVKAGDFVMVGIGKLLDEFNAKTSLEAIKKALAAIKMLRDHLTLSGLDWIEGMEKDLPTG